MYAPSRRIFAKVTFDITDVTAYEDVSGITNTEETAFTDAQQVTNKNREPSYKLATYEDGMFSLDGTVTFPDEVAANNGETGFVSSNLCDEFGVFTSYPQLTVDFSQTHASVGITIAFDSVLGEYAEDFDVIAYDDLGVVIDQVSIVGNTEIVRQALGQLYNYKKLVFTIKKWSKPYRRARVLEVDFGIVKVYDGEGLIRLGLIEELDLVSGQIPSAEFKFEVDNRDRVFNILNPTGFYKYLQQRQKVYADLGVELEDKTVTYMSLGQFYLDEWTSEEGSMTASFTARTSLDLMSSYNYENLLPTTKTLHQLAVDIFTICGITDYELDVSLSSINTDCLVKRTNCRQVLQMIAIAGLVNIFVTREGKIKVTKVDTIGELQDEITFDNTYSEPRIQLEKIVKSVEVTYYTDLDTETITSVSAIGVTEGATLSVTDNTLINTSLRATAVADWILSQTNNRRAKYSVDFRGNPAHELADIVSIENSYGTSKNVIITKNEITYEGYLKTRLEAKGVAE